MTKLFGLLSALVALAVCSFALPAPTSTVVSRDVTDDIKHREQAHGLQARQYHNADYGSDSGPMGDPGSSTVSATVSSATATQTMNSAQKARRGAADNVNMLLNATASLLPSTTSSVLSNAVASLLPNATTPQSNATTPILPSALASLMPTLTPNAAFQNAESCGPP